MSQNNVGNPRTKSWNNPPTTPSLKQLDLTSTFVGDTSVNKMHVTFCSTCIICGLDVDDLEKVLAIRPYVAGCVAQDIERLQNRQFDDEFTQILLLLFRSPRKEIP